MPPLRFNALPRSSVPVDLHLLSPGHERADGPPAALPFLEDVNDWAFFLQQGA